MEVRVRKNGEEIFKNKVVIFNFKKYVVFFKLILKVYIN